MLKSICLATVCLLSHVSALGGCNSGNVDYHDSNDNNISRVSEVQSAYQSNFVRGTYNFVNYFDGQENRDKFHNDDFWYRTFNFEFDLSTDLCLCPLSFGGNSYGLRFLQDIDVYIDDDEIFYITFYWYDSNSSYSSNYLEIPFGYGDLQDLNSVLKDVIFDIPNMYSFDDDYMLVFNALFTHEDNYFVTSYIGYYNFYQNISYDSNSANHSMMIGSVTFNNNLYRTLEFKNDYVIEKSLVQCLRYDLHLQHYYIDTYYMPFNKDQIVSINSYLNVKMSVDNFNRFNSIGVFSFIRQDTEPSDFRDLLLTIADVPVYFISQFLNFELFGFNLFVACASLVTLLVVIFVVRKLF